MLDVMSMYEVRRYCDDCGEWRSVRAAQKNVRETRVKCRKHMARKAPQIGRRLTHSSGYVMVRTESGWKYEHRVLWAAEHGPIPTGFHVHHINGVRDDNRAENLELVHGRSHNREHTTVRHADGLLNAVGSRSSRWNGQLDNDQIVARRDAGETWKSIAASMGVSPPTVALHYRRTTEAAGGPVG